MAGRERTDPNCICVGKKEAFARMLQLSIISNSFLCVERILVFGDKIFKRCVFTVLCVLQAVQSLEISF